MLYVAGGLFHQRYSKALTGAVAGLFITGAVLSIWSVASYWRLRHFIETSDSRLVALLNDHSGGGHEYPKFSPVNRSPDYLLNQALELARSRGIEERVHALYRPEEELKRKERSKKLREERRKKWLERQKEFAVQRKRTRVPLREARPVSQGWEPLFSLPLDRSQFWLSSPFGPRGRRRRLHTGIDMAANMGTPVKAAGDGIVVIAHQERGYGKTVVIEHERGWRTRYAHLSAILTRPGRTVREGDVIGRVGATGHIIKRPGGSGAHLHFEVINKRGAPVNPFYLLKD